MVSYAGFYVTPKAWTEWLKSHLTYAYQASSLNPYRAEMKIHETLRQKHLEKHFAVVMVRVPPSEEADYINEARTLMIVRIVNDRRVYIPPRPDSMVDKLGPQILWNKIGLKVEGWRTIWYNRYSYQPPYDSQFLEPELSYDHESHGMKDITGGEQIKIGIATKGEVMNKEEDECSGSGSGSGNGTKLNNGKDDKDDKDSHSSLAL
ncbi:hypothetical protein ACGC1H_007613 [Rhizoctonia solani]